MKKAELSWSKDNALELEPVKPSSATTETSEQDNNALESREHEQLSANTMSEAEELPLQNMKKKKEKTKKSKKTTKTKHASSKKKLTNDVDGNVTSEVETCDESACVSSSKGAGKYQCATDTEAEGEEYDDTLRIAELKLQKLRQKKLRLQQIEAETLKLEQELSSKTVPKRRAKVSTKVTTKDLRSMGDVAAKVDRMMDEKKLKFKDCSSSSSEYESDAEGSDSSLPDSDGSEEETSKKKKRKSKKKKSGKNKKLTSSVKHPQEYPHSNLKFHFVGKEKKYEDLSIAEFCAGYMSIVKSCEKSQREARIDHLEELMYHATTRPWKCVLNYHAACVLKIERGNLK